MSRARCVVGNHANLDALVDERTRSAPSPAPADDPGSGWAFPTLAEHLATSREDEARHQSRDEPPLIVVGPSLDPRRIVEALPPDAVVLTASDLGEAGATLSRVIDLSRHSRSDVLLLSDPDATVTGDMLDGLRAGLQGDTTCASVSLDADSRPAAPGILLPGTPAPRPGIVLLSGAHLVLAADDGLAPGSGTTECDGGGVVEQLLALVDRPGFVHRSYGGAGPDAPRQPVRDRSGRRRPSTPVLIDGRCLEYPAAGTQVQLLGLLEGLARAGADIALLTPPRIHPSVRDRLDRLTTEVELVQQGGTSRPEIFHRPHQVGSLDVLADCLRMGERLVLTHQDMIFDRTPAYHVDPAGWRDYRSATAASLASADAVGFFTYSAAMDAASDGDLDLDRATVVPLGVDHLARIVPSEMPARPLGGRPYLLMAGSALWHKNRLFALRLLRRLVEHDAWDGGLVLVGGHIERGSSVEAERRLVGASPALEGRVVDLGHVEERDQLALYRDAELVLFPSLYEGFGFIPFEAAAVDTACVYSHLSAMRELLPDAGALPSFDVDDAGELVMRLLESPSERSFVVDQINAAGSELTWDRTAAGYLEVYERALSREPSRISRRLVGSIARREDVLRTRSEAVLINVYRRRRGFRVIVDSTLRAGQLAAAGARRLRPRGARP